MGKVNIRKTTVTKNTIKLAKTTLNVDALISLIKRRGIANWIKKQDPTIFF
jgi:hypothetical protein